MNKLGRPKQYDHKLLLFLTEAQREAVRTYRFERGIGSEAEALRELIDVGLGASRKPREFRQAAIPARGVGK